MLGPIRYAVEEIRENYDRRTWWQDRIADRLIGPVQHRLFSYSILKVLDRDWDNLIVLDACRADLFEEIVGPAQFNEYERVYSAGSATPDWCRSNFSGQARTDCIYVTGNPVVSRHVSTAFHCFLEPWRDSFDSDSGTVPPAPVTEAAIQARDRHPEKRLIVHYLQPHYPFIQDPHLRYTAFNQTSEFEVQATKSGAKDVWEAVGLGYEDAAEVWEAYGRNLELVMDAIEPLLELDGRTVVTSDHGNLLGEPMPLFRIGLYGHPSGIHHPVLREVPWAVISGDRAETAYRRVDADMSEQLRSLGYAE